MGSSINLSEVGTRLEPQDADDQRNYVADLLDRRQTTFPGAQPVSFARGHIEELQQHDYFMCEKTDGIRCLMYLNQYTDPGGVHEAQFLIDRKNDYYFIPGGRLHVPRAPAVLKPGGEAFDLHTFHTGTLLDGELVLQTRRSPDGHETKRLTYLMFDILALDGENVMPRTFDKRMARLEHMVWRPYRKFAERYPQEVPEQPFDMEMKSMEFAYAAEMMFRDKIPRLPHGNDGLIFTCVGTVYTPGTYMHILKWKPPQENTIDFRLEIGSFPLTSDGDGAEEYEDYDAQPEIELQINHGGHYEYYATLHLAPAEWSATKALNQQIDGRIIECYRDPDTGQWRPKLEADGSPRFRDDKTESNHISTVRSVEQSIRDAVSEQDLMDNAAAIRKGVKARQSARAEEGKAAERAKAAGEKRKRDAQAQAQAQTKVQGPPVEQRRKVEEVVKEEEDDGPRI
ncbi:Dcp1p-Dcp2p decapping enzyme complex alpha subunit [Teratosphaeriaceae sp. CCFEE 6253]|nr:Dcp1p-Dcp2p decapping enzyme complex alpha subunit [Teratosphaeriaceae sp. CCFEE 6253]